MVFITCKLFKQYPYFKNHSRAEETPPIKGKGLNKFRSFALRARELDDVSIKSSFSGSSGKSSTSQGRKSVCKLCTLDETQGKLAFEKALLTSKHVFSLKSIKTSLFLFYIFYV